MTDQNEYARVRQKMKPQLARAREAAGLIRPNDDAVTVLRGG